MSDYDTKPTIENVFEKMQCDDWRRCVKVSRRLSIPVRLPIESRNV